jgi:peroxiredoxin family protein
MEPFDCTVLVMSGTQQALRSALGVAMMELAYGRRVLVALLYDGLAAWCVAMRGERLGAGALPWSAVLERRLPSLGDLAGLRRECAELGQDRFRVVACGASSEALGLSIEELVQGGAVDDVVGLPSIWRWSEGARLVSV